MAITLTLITAPPATPVTRNSTQQKSFDSDYYILNAPNISTRERLAIAIVGITHAQNLYKTTHAALIQDAMVYFGGISEKFDVPSGLAGVDWSYGQNVDINFSTDVPTIVKEARDLAQLPEDQLWRIWAFLEMKRLL